jgi:hypothetical protein
LGKRYLAPAKVWDTREDPIAVYLRCLGYAFTIILTASREKVKWAIEASVPVRLRICGKPPIFGENRVFGGNLKFQSLPLIFKKGLLIIKSLLFSAYPKIPYWSRKSPGKCFN